MINDRLTSAMVPINALQTTSTPISINSDEQTILDDLTATIADGGISSNDFLTPTSIGLKEGINSNFESPNIYTYRKVMKLFLYFSYFIINHHQIIR